MVAEKRQGLRGVPGHRRRVECPAPSACSSASGRWIAASTRSTWSTARTAPISSCGSATPGSRLPARGGRSPLHPAHYYDPDGLVTTRVWLSSLGYNTNLVKAEDAPRSFADLLDPKWMGKMVKGHPAYSGTIMNATFQIVREPRLAVSGEAREATRDAGAVVDRSAEEARARRARGDGRRQRPSDPAGGGTAGRGGLSRQRYAAGHRAERGVSSRPPTRTRASVQNWPYA